MKTHDSIGRPLRATSGACGPKKIPDKVHAAKSGTLGTTPPASLKAAGKEWWKKATAKMRALGILDAADCFALERCGQWVDRRADALKDLEKNGEYQTNLKTGIKSANPAVYVLNKADEVYGKCLSDFGLTPSARAKFGGGSEKEEDPFDAILRAKSRN